MKKYIVKDSLSASTFRSCCPFSILYQPRIVFIYLRCKTFSFDSFEPNRIVNVRLEKMSITVIADGRFRF